jgi:hypothetical protein
MIRLVIRILQLQSLLFMFVSDLLFGCRFQEHGLLVHAGIPHHHGSIDHWRNFAKVEKESNLNSELHLKSSSLSPGRTDLGDNTGRLRFNGSLRFVDMGKSLVN